MPRRRPNPRKRRQGVRRDRPDAAGYRQVAQRAGGDRPGPGRLALLSPISRIEVQGRVGLLLVLAAVLEIAHGFRRSTAAGQRAAWVGGAITLAMGVLLINAPYFAVDGARPLPGRLVRPRRPSLPRRRLPTARTRAAPPWSGSSRASATSWSAWRCSSLRGQVLVPGRWPSPAPSRIFGTALNIFLSPVFTAGDSGDTAVADLGLPDDPEMQALARRIAEEESARASIDRGWILGFIATLFAIHVGRMGFDRTFLGIMSPGFAVLGDLAIALLLAFVVVIPCSVLWRRLTRGLERRAWRWCLTVPEEERGWVRRAVRCAAEPPAPLSRFACGRRATPSARP